MDAVRVALGNTGSKTTIHRYLKELEAEATTAPASDIVISDALRTLVAQLSKRLAEEADTRIAEAKAKFDAAAQKAAEALAHQEREGRALSDRLQRTEAVLQEEKRAHEEARGQLHERAIAISALKERATGLEARLAEQAVHAQSLEEKHSQARQALEHFRQSAKEQREAEARRHEHQVQTLQVELRQANELVMAKNHEVMQLNRDNARLTELQGQSESALRTLRREHDQAARTAKEVPRLEKEAETLAQQCLRVTNERDQLRADVERYVAELAAERQARLADIEDQRRREARLSAIEEFLCQLKTKEPVGASPEQD